MLLAFLRRFSADPNAFRFSRTRMTLSVLLRNELTTYRAAVHGAASRLTVRLSHFRPNLPDGPLPFDISGDVI